MSYSGLKNMVNKIDKLCNTVQQLKDFPRALSSHSIRSLSNACSDIGIENTYMKLLIRLTAEPGDLLAMISSKLNFIVYDAKLVSRFYTEYTLHVSSININPPPFTIGHPNVWRNLIPTRSILLSGVPCDFCYFSLCALPRNKSLDLDCVFKHNLN